MNVKLKPFLALISVVMLVSTGSFIAGRQVEQHKVLFGTGINKEESTQIAFVNQDSGTTYKDKSVNYASDLVKSLDSDFVLTNREAGKSGMEDGKYAAMVIIPGNFSKNITTINDVTPSKVEVYYETNDNVSEETKLLVKAKISDFEKKLNNKLSYMYVSSIFSELHQGQDSVSDILKNDNNDLDAIDSINDVNILEAINLTELEDQEIDVKDLNLNKNFEENQNIINEINEKYQDRLISRDKQFDELRNILVNKQNSKYDVLEDNENVNIDEVNSFIENLTKENGGIDNIVNTYNHNVLSVLNDKGKNAISKNTENLTKVKDTTNSSLSTIRNNSLVELEQLKSNLINGNDPKLQSLNEEYLFYGQMINELIKTNPGAFEDVYKRVVDKNNVDLYKILKDPTLGMTPSNTFRDWNELKLYITTGENSTSALSRRGLYTSVNLNDSKLNYNINLINNVSNELNDIQGKLSETSVSTNNVINDPDYKYINNLLCDDAQKTTLAEKLKLNDSLIKDIKENIGGNGQKALVSVMQKNNIKNVQNIKFKVLKEANKTSSNDGSIDIDNLIYIINQMEDASKDGEDKEITELWNKYETSNENIQKLVTLQLDDYDKVLKTTTEIADKHITTMQEDLDNGIKASQEKIAVALQNAKSTKENSAYTNKEKLDSLSNVLSNSRVGTVENTDMYNFMISPVSVMKTENLFGQVSQPVKSNNYNMDGEIGILSTIGFIALGIKLLKNKRNKNLS